MLARVGRALASAAAVPPVLAARASRAAAAELPCAAAAAAPRRCLAAQAEGSKERVVKKKIRKARQFRRVLTPTEEVLPPHQAFVESLPESEAPYVAGSSRRVGVLALKCGMVPEWDVWGVRHALTVLKVRGLRFTWLLAAAMRCCAAPSCPGRHCERCNSSKWVVGFLETFENPAWGLFGGRPEAHCSFCSTGHSHVSPRVPPPSPVPA